MERRDEMYLYASSQCEMGSDAGKVTWENAIDEADRDPLLNSQDEIDEAKSWAGEFGAWEEEEISKWTDQEVNAFVLQFIAGDIRGREHYGSDDEWFAGMESGRSGGSIFQSGDKWYAYIGG